MIRTFALTVSLGLTLAACNSGSSAPAGQPEESEAVTADGAGVSVDSNGLRLSANPAAPSAAYLVLTGDGQPMTLTGVRSTAASRVEMHESVREDGMATMRPLEQIDIPANGEVVMRSGGIHLMIFDVNEAARTAQAIPLELTFANGTRVTIQTSVADLTARESGAPADHADHSNH